MFKKKFVVFCNRDQGIYIGRDNKWQLHMHIYDHFLMMTTLYTKENASKLLFYTPYNEVFHIINPITKSVLASGLINDDGNNQEIHYS